uniref:Uncharacterized protein n=1 Tax=Oryza nivara TaxID=4536 RepID=A0A0E0GXG9_ORYNI
MAAAGREEKHLINRDGRNLFLENTIIFSILKCDGASNLGHKNYKDATVVTRVANYLANDMEDITKFRSKLASILWCSKYNTRKVCMQLEPKNEDYESPSDVQIVETPNDVLKPSEVSHRIEPDTSLCIVAPGTTLTNRKELLGALCKYVMSIDCAESLQKEWIRSMKPYPISLSLRNLQDILDARIFFILNPLHIPNTIRGPHPTLHYVHKIANIAVNAKLAIEETNPTWNDDIYLWNRKIPRDVPKTKNRGHRMKLYIGIGCKARSINQRDHMGILVINKI